MAMSTSSGDIVTKKDDIFANSTYFPAFQDLCDENDLDYRYWYMGTHGTYVQSCTWCFLGEITNDEMSQIPMLRNRVFVRDRSGQDNIPISFYPERGFFDFRTLKKGHTICIMLAEKHHFLDLTYGFRVECLDLVKVIPCSLSDLLALSTAYSECSDPRVCWSCGQTAEEELKKCSSCKVARYCNRECQAKDWKQRHKRWCKAVPEFIKMTKIDYSVYDENGLFPPFSLPGRIW